MPRGSNVTWHPSAITVEQRRSLLKQRSFVLCFTGLSGSGKSTLSVAIEQLLHEHGYAAYRLDGDNIRHGLNANLGFSPEDRSENIRRIAEVSKLFVDSGLIVLTAFIAPYHADRDFMRSLVRAGEFVEVYVRCPVEVCEQRDVKGLYAKARAGEIKDFTGISAPYEEPKQPEIVIDTETQSLETATQQLWLALEAKGYLQRT